MKDDRPRSNTKSRKILIVICIIYGCVMGAILFPVALEISRPLYSKKHILNMLEEKYQKEFEIESYAKMPPVGVFRGRVYKMYPIEDSSLEFWVMDSIEGGPGPFIETFHVFKENYALELFARDFEEFITGYSFDVEKDPFSTYHNLKEEGFPYEYYESVYYVVHINNTNIEQVVPLVLRFLRNYAPEYRNNGKYYDLASSIIFRNGDRKSEAIDLYFSEDEGMNIPEDREIIAEFAGDE